MRQSIWTVTARTVEHYKKFNATIITKDVSDEFRAYSTFDGMSKNTVVSRITSAIYQSLRVRGVNALFRMRSKLISYEKQITNEISELEMKVIECKITMCMHGIPFTENTDIEKLKHYLYHRDKYLKAKVKLESKILERKNLRNNLKITADDILKESK